MHEIPNGDWTCILSPTLYEGLGNEGSSLSPATIWVLISLIAIAVAVSEGVVLYKKKTGV